jgi:hypothetical protein
MSYIGKSPVAGNFVKLDTITTSATTTFNLLNGGVAYFPQSANNCLVSLNGIIQAPTDSYTISGSTIIFSSALTTSDVIDFIIVLGDVLNIGTPSDNTVSLAKLTASGTKDATTFLRGDNTFASAGATAGQVIQVVSSSDSTQRSTTSTSFVTGSSTLTLSITPSSASNKIFVICSTYIQPQGSGYDTYITLYRNSTNLGTANGMGNIYDSGTRTNGTLTFYDSPATTSATTYEFRMKVSAGTSYINANNTTGTITAFEIKG